MVVVAVVVDRFVVAVGEVVGFVVFTVVVGAVDFFVVVSGPTI